MHFEQTERTLKTNHVQYAVNIYWTDIERIKYLNAILPLLDVFVVMVLNEV